MISINKKGEYEDELKASNMMKKEHFIASKRFADPKTGAAAGKDGKSFNWVLYGLSLYETKRFDEDAEKYVVENFDGLEVSFFKSAKSFVDKVDKIDVGVKFKVTQIPVEGKSYSEFVVEELEKVDAPVQETPVSKAAPAVVPLMEQIKTLKAAGITKEMMFGLVKDGYDTTEMIVNAIYDAQ